MLRGVLRWTVLFILAAMLAGHATELFDHWDHTLKTGKDADYAVVMIAACAGFAFLAATSLVVVFATINKRQGLPAESSLPLFQMMVAERVALGPSPPPPVSLRI